MENLFELVPEKYWDFTKKYTKEQKESEIQSRIASDEYIASLKKDGHYNRFVKHNGISKMQTRGISTVTGEYGDKILHVPYIATDLVKLPDNTILIGELYQHGKKDRDMTSILGCGVEKSLARQEGEYGRVYYYIHDCWFFNGEDLRNKPYETRISFVQDIYKKYLKENKYIECAHYAKTPKDIRELLTFAWDNDEEGIVMVRKAAKVECGKRTSWKTIKVKKELEKEVDCFFTGKYKEATRLYTGKELENWIFWEDSKTGKLFSGKYYEDYCNGLPIDPVTKPYFYGWAGSIELGLLKNGEPMVFGYVSGIDDNIKKDIVENNGDYVCRPCCCTAMEFTEDGRMRHPKFLKFRDDLNLEDCSWEKVFGD